MTIFHVLAIPLVASIGAWALREAFRTDRPGCEVRGQYGNWTRTTWPDEDDQPF